MVSILGDGLQRSRIMCARPLLTLGWTPRSAAALAERMGTDDCGSGITAPAPELLIARQPRHGGLEGKHGGTTPDRAAAPLCPSPRHDQRRSVSARRRSPFQSTAHLPLGHRLGIQVEQCPLRRIVVLSHATQHAHIWLRAMPIKFWLGEYSPSRCRTPAAQTPEASQITW